MRRWRSLHWLIWPVLLLVLLWLARSLPFGDVWAVLAAVNPLALVGLVAFNALIMIVFSSRWWLALRAQGHGLNYLVVFRYRMAAFAISYFTPGTQFGGEPLQVYTVSSRHAVPPGSAVASVTLDKLFELLANYTFLAVGVLVILRRQLFIDLPSGAGTLGAASLLVLPLAYLLLLWKGLYPVSWLVAKISAGWPKKLAARLKIQVIAEVAKTAEAQIHTLFHRQPGAIFGVVGASLIIWVLSLAEYWLSLRVLGAQLDLGQTVVALTVSRLAFLTPWPGGLGALEAGQMLALESMGFDPAIGLAVSLWIRVRDTALGLMGLWWGAGLFNKPAVETPQPLSLQAGD